MFCKERVRKLKINSNLSEPVKGELPAAWGINGAFPQLQELDLGQNTGISGTLPAAWGSDNSSMTDLRRFKISTASLTGSLPAQWAQNLPAMSNLNISNNLITGEGLCCSGHEYYVFVLFYCACKWQACI